VAGQQPPTRRLAPRRPQVRPQRRIAYGAALAVGFGLLLAGPALAQGVDASGYRDFPFIGSRLSVWIAAQIGLMFAAFVLAVPMFAGIVEFVGWRAGEKRYDDLAREMTKLLLVAFSATAALGGTLTFMLFVLYPGLMQKMTDVFRDSMLLFPFLFFGEAISLYLYWYGWDRMMNRKGLHLLLNLSLNVFGTLIMFIANAWSTFMISPQRPGGTLLQVDLAANTFTWLGSTWQAINNPTWWPLNIHRLIANAAFGGAIVGAYAAFKFLAARSEEERAHYDWMGYVGNFIAVSALLPLPFAGYWFGREIYEFSQSMGITMMGGFLSWLWIIQALLIGVLFMTANYYLWLGLQRIEGGERYTRFTPYLVTVLIIGWIVWATPHTIVATPREMAQLGGSYHPLLGWAGVMSAKNTAVNLMILTTFLSFLLYRRGNKGEPPAFTSGLRGAVVPWIGGLLGALLVLPSIMGLLRAMGEADGQAVATMASQPVRLAVLGLHLAAVLVGPGLLMANRGKLGQALVFCSASLVVLYFGVVGYMVPAAVRIGFSVYQVLAVLSTLLAVTALDIALFRAAPSLGPIRWGDMPERSQYALFLLAITFTWLMGLMGYARNGIRQNWHVWETLADQSVDASLPGLGFVAQVITLCVLLFWAMIALIFWIGDLGTHKSRASEQLATAPRAAPAPVGSSAGWPEA
jgi:cytochrome bd-type quinol oxidase subunit 1